MEQRYFAVYRSLNVFDENQQPLSLESVDYLKCLPTKEEGERLIVFKNYDDAKRVAFDNVYPTAAEQFPIFTLSFEGELKKTYHQLDMPSIDKRGVSRKKIAGFELDVTKAILICGSLSHVDSFFKEISLNGINSACVSSRSNVQAESPLTNAQAELPLMMEPQFKVTAQKTIKSLPWYRKKFMLQFLLSLSASLFAIIFYQVPAFRQLTSQYLTSHQEQAIFALFLGLIIVALLRGSYKLYQSLHRVSDEEKSDFTLPY